ncbi:DISEASE RESISTANCE PROTEIN RFL1-RELATED [Salix viminalis]|uniref:DISEASE RESISTANCE PROTEIN RFL1-RELATED n=1 Tax=Salix viminalis TaxID=40686 RepID=A0A9Q0ZK60_SALVM|nr:DISEASE RESISTANCE PROTEIN RFL1-RELATED [Salix viminalis]
MGGVGKTTLLTQIHNESLKQPNDFDIVIWVVVSKDFKLNAAQESIRKKIGFSDDFWKNKSSDERAVDIFNALSQKRFVMLLDDIWERVDLNKLGVPVPDMNNGSKVVFTTRSERICGQMEAHKIVKVDCLEPEDAWDLFQKKVGDQTLCFHPDKDDCVRMHDVIRDMALWIASDIERDQQKIFVQTGAQLSKAPEVGKWEGVRRVSLMANHIEHLSETPSCSNLRTLFLGRIHLSKISRVGFVTIPESFTNRHKGAANRVESIGKVEISEPGVYGFALSATTRSDILFPDDAYIKNVPLWFF